MPAVNRGRMSLVVKAWMVTALVLSTYMPAVSASAAVRVSGRERPFPGLTFEHVETVLENGDTVRGTVTRFSTGDPYLRLRTVQSGDQMASLETVLGMERRLAGQGALAAVNGGFWVDPPDGGPTGRPHGVSVMSGELETGARTLWGTPGYRGTMGINVDGSVVFSRLAGALTLTREDGAVVPIDEMNTQLLNTRGWDRQILLYTPRYPSAVEIPENGLAVVLDGLEMTPGGITSPTVTGLVEAPDDPRSIGVPAGGGVVVAQAAARHQLDDLTPGASVQIAAGIFALDGDPDAWARVTSALPGGPYLVRDGARTRSADWIAEGFGNERHNGPRVPRTAVGVTATDEILLVTVDGRQPGWSAGMNMWEFANFMIELGAVEALSLDGGGSTTATVLGQVRNHPSDGGPRPVANALVVTHSYPFDHSTQIGGRDRYETAAKIAIQSFPDGADTVVIAKGHDYPDALAGGPLAALLDAPLLLTDTAMLPDTTAHALAELAPSRIVLLGGEAAVSDEVVTQLTGLGYSVQRVSGANRHATAASIAEAMVGEAAPETVVLASGRGFADALVAAAPAGRLGAPVLLTEPAELPAATTSFLRDHTPEEVVIVGGHAVVHPEVETLAAEAAEGADVQRLDGPDRYATADAIAEWATARLGLGTELVVARGDTFPDALSGGPFAARRGATLMIVPPTNVLDTNAASTAWLERHAGPLDQVDLLGGTSVLSLYQRVQLDQLTAR